jgi:biopolymer transport protein ExbD
VTSSDHSKRLFVRADKTVPYGDVMTLMNDLRGAGYLKIALVGLESAGAQPADAASQSGGAQ